LGILCNWLVCLAVWLAYGAESMTGKILGIFFPIWLFVTSGFEHSVANMYYIPAGLLAKETGAYVESAIDAGASSAAVEALSWQGFFLHNLIPVTLGNIIGGGVFVSLAYLLAYRIPKGKV
jgi:formate/nitrite transporter